MRDKVALRDRAIADMANRHHGLVTARQLLTAGIDADAVRRRVVAGRLHRLHRGVYAVGHTALSREGRLAAAVLACGPKAFLSHRSAAELWGMLPACSGPIHVTICGPGGRPRRGGIRIHRSETLTEHAVGRRLGIAVTTPTRTVADLRHSEPAAVLRNALRGAAVAGFEIEQKQMLKTRSELEDRFLRLCRRHRLPLPDVNVRVGGLTVDFLWPSRSLVVETDGYRYHRGIQAFEDDRKRDIELRLRGYEVVRFSYRQVVQEPARTAAALKILLRTGD